METKNEFNPIVAIHPGKLLQGELAIRAMTQADFAERTKITTKNLSEIINGKANITPRIAIELELALGVPANFWLNMQIQYEEAVARGKAKAELERDLELLPLFPYAVLRKVCSSLPDTRDKEERAMALRKFYCVSSLAIVCESIKNGQYGVGTTKFRTSGIGSKREIDQFALSGWIQAGRLKSLDCILDSGYDRKKLSEFARQIPKITGYENITDAWNVIRDGLNKCGVKVILVPYLAKTYVNGAVYWEENTPVIMLNCKTSYWDSLIFTLLHEIGHILKHGKLYSGLSFDESATVEIESKEELEADTFARNTLIDPEEYEFFVKKKTISEFAIRNFARELMIDAGIVATRLATDEYIKWPYISRYRKQVQIA